MEPNFKIETNKEIITGNIEAKIKILKYEIALILSIINLIILLIIIFK